MRADGRQHDDELRPLDLIPDFVELAHGSVLYSQGKTRVLCTAMVEEGVPRWLHRSGRGWMTAEYSLLPASTGERVAREAAKGKQGGRTVEIQRLIGRALRSVVRLPGARRAHPLARLRRAPGRRRHALRCDLGRVRRRLARTRPLRALEGAQRPDRRRLGRRRRGQAAARPRLLGGLDRGDGHERRHDRGRPPRRGAGDRRAGARSPARCSTRCSTSPPPGSRRSWRRRTTAVAAERVA